MKSIYAALLFFLLPILTFGQNVNGIWSGTLLNDSTKQTQKFEMALSEYKGNITGYSYTTFIANDTFYYSIKKITATIKNNELIVEDDKMLVNNFPERAAKGVKQTTIIPVTTDSMTSLSGKWTTNRTKVFYSLSGTMQMKRENDSNQSALVAHLEELEVAKKTRTLIAEKKVVIPKKEEKKHAVVKATPVKKESTATKETGKEKISLKDQNLITKEELSSQTTVVTKDVAANNKPITKEIKPPTEIKTVTKEELTSQTVVVTKDITTNNKSLVIKPRPLVDKKSTDQKIIVNNSSAEEKKKVPIKTEVAATTIHPAANEVKPKIEETKKEILPVKTEITPLNNSIYRTVNAELILAERKTVSSRTITISSDSLVLSFYDNGIVDGDSISVYLNGKIIVDKERLSERAMKRTIYITDDMPDSLELVLYAENMGSIPPNTGLVMIRNGGEVYDVRFSADYSRNASIIFRRRK